jgi:hypothetical protein
MATSRPVCAAVFIVVTLAGCGSAVQQVRPAPDASLAPLGAPTETAISVTTPLTTVTDTVRIVTTATGPITTFAVPIIPKSPTPGVTAPLPTLPPAATEPPPETDPVPCTGCLPEYSFPYANFFEVPQMGSEPVRGTGCGADGSLGETIPDGYWHGTIDVGVSALSIDVSCVYYGDSAAPFAAECVASGGDNCLEFGTDFWQVNNNTRTRTMPLDDGFRRRYAQPDGCSDPGPGAGETGTEGSELMDSWIVIENGRVTFALTSCVYG